MAVKPTGIFIPSSQVWDTSQIESVKGISPELKELFVRMYQNLNSMALAINNKETGIYHTEEFITGELFPPDENLSSASETTPKQRPGYRKVINIGTLPDTASIQINHGIAVNAGYEFTRIRGYAIDPIGLEFIPIPYASANGTDNIEISVSGAAAPNDFVTITTGSDRTNFTKCKVFLDYTKW